MLCPGTHCQVGSNGNTNSNASQQQSAFTAHHHSNNINEILLAHFNPQRFRKKDKFTGILIKNINECHVSYDEACSDYDLNEDQELEYPQTLWIAMKNSSTESTSNNHQTTILFQYKN